MPLVYPTHIVPSQEMASDWTGLLPSTMVQVPTNEFELLSVNRPRETIGSLPAEE